MRRELEDEAVKRIKAANSTVFDRVVDRMAEGEIERRALLVTDALGNLKRLRDDLAKSRPDLVSYDASGAVLSEAYSKGRLEARQRLQRLIDRYEAAFDRAFADEPDYGPLKECVKAVQKQAQPDPGGES